MGLGAYKTFVLVTPDLVTGGPEAMHQLRQILAHMGLNAGLSLYQGEDGPVVRDGVLQGLTGDTAIGDAYAAYEPVLFDRVPLTPETLVILPEVRVSRSWDFGPAKVAIWWLSVVNAFHPDSILSLEHGDAGQRKFFGDRGLTHLCQTFNARNMLGHFGAQNLHDLTDYTDARFTRRPPTGPNDGLAIAYNAAKGARFYEPFFAANPQFEPLPIRGMDKDQVRAALSRTRLFIEFGHNPGKDRMPREAACCGAVVIARREGGSRFHADTPIDEIYKFDEPAVTDGALARLAARILADPRPHWDSQAAYRQILFDERSTMEAQARDLFGG